MAFGLVRDDVIKATGNRQEPFVYGSLGGGNVALVPGCAGRSLVSGLAALPSAAPIAVAPVPPTNLAWRDYELAAQVNSKEVWDAYLETHPTGFYANLARAQRAKLLADGAGRTCDAARGPDRPNARVRDARRHPSGGRGNDPRRQAEASEEEGEGEGEAACHAVRSGE